MVESPGTLSIRRGSPNPASVANLRGGGFDGQVQDGRAAIRRSYKALEDLEALDCRPRYLMTFTLPAGLGAARWWRVKGKLLSKLARLLRRYGGGAYWWQGFQPSSGNPHLHVLTDLPLEWAALLGWAKGAWAGALGGEVPAQAVDLKHRRNFGYARGHRALEQAIAPAKDQWGQWRGFQGTWLALTRQVRETTLQTELGPQDAQALVGEMLERCERLPLPDWLKNNLRRFGCGAYRATWVAKRYLGPEMPPMALEEAPSVD